VRSLVNKTDILEMSRTWIQYAGGVAGGREGGKSCAYKHDVAPITATNK